MAQASFDSRDDSPLDPIADKKRQALLKEFGLTTDLQEAPDPAPAARTLVILGCIALFVASLFFPAITYLRPGMANGELPTWGLLLAGWAFIPGLFLGELWGVGWLANVALVGVIIELSVKQEKWATMTAAFGALFAGLACLIDSVPLNNNGPPFPIESFEVGFYLWQGTMLLALGGSAFLWWLDVLASSSAALEEAPQ
jgi:hypothetical protein